MPELPEVEVVRAGLEPVVIGASVASVTILDRRSLRRHVGPSQDFIDRLTGATFLAPERRGKFLWIPLVETDVAGSVGAGVAAPLRGAPSSSALMIHLGMSGQVLLRDRNADDALTRIRLEIVSPEHGDLRLNFVDQRIFGSMAIDELVATSDRPDQHVPSQVLHIARDPLDPFFDDELFFARLAKKNTGIKRALLDQSLISGIGNIYADESLWAAKLHYDQPALTLSRAKKRMLLKEVRHILEKALDEGGTSFDAQYVNVNGASGYFSHSLNAYGQHGKACPRCGRPILREQFMNRGSHFCPWCQRLRLS